MEATNQATVTATSCGATMSPARRRPRRGETVLLVDAKAAFQNTVSSAVHRLRVQHGYAPERAARAILQEISRHAFASKQAVSGKQQQEDQLYALMQKLRIGSEQARRALTVSLAIDELCRTNDQTPAQALMDLTAHLEKAELLERADDSHATDSGVGMKTAVVQPPPTKTRIRPADSRAVRNQKRPKLAATATKAVTAAPKAQSKTSAETVTSSRPRADSFTNEVAAKLEDSKVAAASGAATTDTNAARAAAHKPGTPAPAAAAASRNTTASKRSRSATSTETGDNNNNTGIAAHKRARHANTTATPRQHS